ncbi:DUF554 domain-containing protein [Enterococcus casseliflavus]|nr:DUF554 domain-containing protein [Enterococcus casseliflavus]
MMSSIFLNGVSVLIATVVGNAFGKYFSEAYKALLNQVIGLSALVIGLTAITSSVESSDYRLFFILVLVLGATIGQILDLDRRLTQVLNHVPFAQTGGEGLILGITMICIGTFPILGPLQLAVRNDSSFLMINSLFAFIVTLTLSSSYGLVLSLVAPILVAVEFIVYVFSVQLDALMTPIILNEMELAGGILALASGLNILKITKIPVLNLLPVLFAPMVLVFFS